MSRKYIDKSVKVPTLYGILGRAEESGLIQQSRSVNKDGVTRGTSRKYYRLTDEGEHYFKLMRDQLTKVRDVLNFDRSILELKNL